MRAAAQARSPSRRLVAAPTSSPIDLSPQLVQLARDRLPSTLAGTPGAGRITFLSGDMLDPSLGRFDHIVAMDSLIHYRTADMAEAVAKLAARTERSVVFTYAPRTPLLTLMHAAGKLFPRGDRSPAIEPASRSAIGRAIASSSARAGVPLRLGRTQRITTGFYISQAQEVVTA